MDRVDATLRNIDAAIAASEPNIERAKALCRPEVPEPGPWARFRGRLVWILCLEWLP